MEKRNRRGVAPSSSASLLMSKQRRVECCGIPLKPTHGLNGAPSRGLGIENCRFLGFLRISCQASSANLERCDSSHRSRVYLAAMMVVLPPMCVRPNPGWSCCDSERTSLPRTSRSRCDRVEDLVPKVFHMWRPLQLPGRTPGHA
jgi:hypothetical protein